MSVVTEAQYRLIATDSSTATSAVAEALDSAEAMVQIYLGRYLANGIYTERLKVWPSGFAYPAAVPVTEISASANGEIYDDATLWNVSPDDTPFTGFMYPDPGYTMGHSLVGRAGSGYETYYAYGTVQYTGGWDSTTMPYTLIRYICLLAKSLANGGQALNGAAVGGAYMIRVGDVQVNYPPDQVGALLNQYVPGMAAAIRGWRLGRL